MHVFIISVGPVGLVYYYVLCILRHFAQQKKNMSAFIDLTDDEETMMTAQYPEFACPIGHKVMHDPVMTPNGQTYDRGAIVQWIQRKGGQASDPMLGGEANITVEKLVPNHALRNTIEAALRSLRSGYSYGGGGRGGSKRSAADGAAEKEDDRSTKQRCDRQSTLESNLPYRKAVLGEDGQLYVCMQSNDTVGGIDFWFVVDVSGSMKFHVKPAPTTNSAGSSGASGESGAKWRRIDMIDAMLQAAFKTIGHTLGGFNTPMNHRAGLVQFATNATLLSPLQAMTADNVKGLQKKADDIRVPGNGKNTTNVYAGLQTALAQIEDKLPPRQRQIVIILLTDGEVNEPEKAPDVVNNEWATLKTMFPRATERATVHVVAVGREPNPRYCLDLAEETGGNLYFMPGPNMIGSVSQRLIARLLTTTMTHVVVGGVDIGQLCRGQRRHVILPPGSFRVDESKTHAFIRVRYGTSLDTDLSFLKCRNHLGDDTNPVELAFALTDDCLVEPTEKPKGSSGAVSKDSSVLCEQRALRFRDELLQFLRTTVIQNTEKKMNRRYNWIAVVQHCLVLDPNAQHELRALGDRYADTVHCSLGKALLQDIGVVSTDDGERGGGELLLALDPQHFTEWGRLYLPAYVTALLTESPINTLDPSSLHYLRTRTCATFQTISAHAQIQFLSTDIDLDRAEPKRRVHNMSVRGGTPSPPAMSFRSVRVGGAVASSGSGSSSQIASPYPSMRMTSVGASGYEHDGPCFAGQCKVLVLDPTNSLPSMKRLDGVKRGDQISAPGCWATVQYVLKTICPSGKHSLVRLGDSKSPLYVTSTHPVRTKKGGSWDFPKDLGTPIVTECEAVYSLLLVDNTNEKVVVPSCFIEGVECIGLNHGITDDPVATHSFFGTNKVGDALSRLDPDGTGLVVLDGPHCVQRDPETGWVCGLLNGTPGQRSM